MPVIHLATGRGEAVALAFCGLAVFAGEFCDPEDADLSDCEDCKVAYQRSTKEEK